MLYKCTVSKVDHKKKTVDINITEKGIVFTGANVLESCGWLQVGDMVYVLTRESNNVINWCIVLGREMN